MCWSTFCHICMNVFCMKIILVGHLIENCMEMSKLVATCYFEYTSRLQVGPLPWLGPQTDQVIEGYGKLGQLATVKKMVLSGWQELKDEELLPFIKRKNELSVQDGCLLWGNGVIIPKLGRQRMMDELHQGYPGDHSLVHEKLY